MSREPSDGGPQRAGESISSIPREVAWTEAILVDLASFCAGWACVECGIEGRAGEDVLTVGVETS